MADEIVLYHKEGPVGLITINRPEVRNALNGPVFQALGDILSRVAGDDEVRVIVITGTGNAFVAGADINELLSFDSVRGWAESRFNHSVLSRLEGLGKPSIAAVNGAALGGGLELALACTLRFAAPEAKMGFPELGLGIIPGFGGTQRLIRTVGRAKAAELLLRRSIIGAEEAKAIGLVNDVTPQGQAVEVAKGVAHDLSSLSPTAVRLTMELLSHSQHEGFDSGLALESAIASLTLSSAEAKKLLGDFVGKAKKK
jgi:enoyl-CoA hydratase